MCSNPSSWQKPWSISTFSSVTTILLTWSSGSSTQRPTPCLSEESTLSTDLTRSSSQEVEVFRIHSDNKFAGEITGWIYKLYLSLILFRMQKVSKRLQEMRCCSDITWWRYSHSELVQCPVNQSGQAALEETLEKLASFQTEYWWTVLYLVTLDFLWRLSF